MPIDPAAVEKEILSGLKHEGKGLDERRKNADYYRCHFEEVEARESPFNVPRESIRTTPLMRRVVGVLTANLYRDGPVRAFPDRPAATALLEEIYRQNNADALWQEADRLAMVNQVAAFEVFGNTGDDFAERPIGLNLWGADDLIVWTDPDDCLKPGAVAVRDEFDHQRRLRLWTQAERVTYLTRKWEGESAGGTAYREVDRIPNPYGVIPFAFVHANFPTRDFWSGGPGAYLREINYHLNCRFTRAADDIRVNRPLPVLENAPPNFRPPSDRKPGQWIQIASVPNAADVPTPDARFNYITCDLGYLQGDWDDLQAHLEHALEMLGVPASALRMEQTQAASGIALVAEQIPLILWAMSRQRPFGCYERGLARLVCRVAAAWAEKIGIPVGPGPDELLAAARVPLSLRWPEMGVELPGEQRNQEDGWKLDRGLMSRVDWLRKREGLTRDEARQRLIEIAEDQAFEQQLLATAAPAAGGPEPEPTDEAFADG